MMPHRVFYAIDSHVERPVAPGEARAVSVFGVDGPERVALVRMDDVEPVLAALTKMIVHSAFDIRIPALKRLAIYRALCAFESEGEEEDKT